MEKKMKANEDTPLEQVGVTVYPDLRLIVTRAGRGLEVHLAPDAAIEIALQLFQFAYQIPGEHQNHLRAIARLHQHEDAFNENRKPAT
jgi:hypothetical protein